MPLKLHVITISGLSKQCITCNALDQVLLLLCLLIQVMMNREKKSEYARVTVATAHTVAPSSHPLRRASSLVIGGWQSG